ncbi:hypothetical protein DUNSADRAFT_16593 [Dunaliella salina]|uniref:Uncharacterized protein n=1 Tax=Dunaliella salina TaxID=3046 RepID=A0ABQ7H0X8_DUNSA|nr:hypothetical protein DUNSADRAFT_16593 [Dunaliella salina]|eukprot:KAF5840502.1 hypothetical protein DUNSADRAFT_16593 [Dunaliella salina]
MPVSFVHEQSCNPATPVCSTCDHNIGLIHQLETVCALPSPPMLQGPQPSQPSCSSSKLPPGSARASALRLHATYINNSCRKGTKQQQQQQRCEVGITLRHLPHVLAAAHSTDAKVRKQALKLFGNMGMQLESYADKDAKSEQGASAAALRPLLSALLHESSLVEADAEAVVVLLRNTFAGAGAPGGRVEDTTEPPPSQTKGGSKRGAGSRGSRASVSAAAEPGRRSTQAALASTQLEMKGGVAAVEASFAHLAQLLGGMGCGVAAGRDGVLDAHVAHVLLRGMLQEPWGVSSCASGEADLSPNGQGSGVGGEGARGAGAGGLPAAATPSQRLALLPHALGLLESLLHTGPQPLSAHAQRLGALLVCCVFSSGKDLHASV